MACKLGLGALRLFAALVTGPAPICGADLDITGRPARVRFLDATDAEHAVLEGGEGWLNATVRLAAPDFVTAGGRSLEELGRRLGDSVDLQAIIESQQATIASQQAIIASQQSVIANQPANANPVISLRTSLTRTSNDGDGHGCALVELPTGNWYKCWGRNANGQLGLGDTTERLTPTTVTALGTNVSSIHAGVFATCCILNDATVKCFGSNNFRQLGLESATDYHTPTTVTMLGTDASWLQIGHFYSCALLKDSTVKCYGDPTLVMVYGAFGNFFSGTYTF